MSAVLALLLSTAAPLALMVNNIFDGDTSDEEAFDEIPTPEEGEGDLLDFVDFEARPDSARAALNGTEDVTRGTDAAAVFEGSDDVENVHDASGGADTLTGGNLDDVLIGGEDGDQISGGAGDDDLFGGFQRASRPDDLDADTLDGGAGDDTLFLGNGDTANGGDGADAFVLVQDATGSVTIEDFDPETDALLIESPAPQELSVTEQTVTQEGVVLTLSTGAMVTLNGLDAPIDTQNILFLDPAATGA